MTTDNYQHSPENSLRSDLWPTMTLPQLTQQQDLVITKLSTLSKIMGPAVNPSYLQIYNALQVALDDLTRLIEYRSTKAN